MFRCGDRMLQSYCLNRGRVGRSYRVEFRSDCARMIQFGAGPPIWARDIVGAFIPAANELVHSWRNRQHVGSHTKSVECGTKN